jgi:hypothetical protein
MVAIIIMQEKSEAGNVACSACVWEAYSIATWQWSTLPHVDDVGVDMDGRLHTDRQTNTGFL